MERENELVLFKNYGNPLIAQFHKALLEDNGIPCVMKDLGFNFPVALFSQDTSGIKILVRNSDLQSAFDLMSEDDDDFDFDSDFDSDLDDAEPEEPEVDFDDDDDDDDDDDFEEDDLRFDEKELEDHFELDNDFSDDDLFTEDDFDDDLGMDDEEDDY